MASLSDIHRAILVEDTWFFGPLDVSIVNFVAMNPFPRTFVYQGCTKRTKNGLYKVSIEGPRPTLCKHEAEAKDLVKYMYHFQIVVFDETLMGNYGKPTLRATIWEAAKDLLLMSLEEFGELSEFDRYLRVHDSLKYIPRCSVTVRVNQGSMHINDLIIVSNNSVLPVCHRWSSTGTPGRERIGSSPQATGIATVLRTPSRHVAAS
ncbi:unnamed protein product [Calypogeia fissa]